MNQKTFLSDKKGQVFTLDVMLAIVLITIILGMSADIMDMASYKISGYTSRFSLERVTSDAADVLIKTSGSPEDWEMKINNFTTPGLASIDNKTLRTVPNTLSIKKINALAKNYNSMIYGKVLPYGVDSRMILYPTNPSLSTIQIKYNDPKNANEIVVANRTVILNLLDVKTVIYGEHKNVKVICPNSSHKTINDTKWACQYLSITSNELNNTDFYIITDPVSSHDDSLWSINRPENGTDNVTGERFNSNPLNINQKLLNLLGDDSNGVLWLHIRSSGERNFDTYIITVPKGTNQTYINLNNINPEPWFFVLEVWY